MSVTNPSIWYLW